ncbi:glycoside hydrolase family 3 C-terminal domain-containing protein [Sphingomonas sp. BT-65]|uniref:glycoside hydrolase family 3 C-terminal domain-containing protein n=1 Tax=Sphingomonas sp. BT-65 TaxID=2989821 RepID=UPI002235E6C0|nr:glycoside hydrolase family 3 C-terminal domain-containing protein [Sphingomonas sp. BT-65]MCW4462046.1 glycoside hydrolase family 3 C-terminal domain-containing protein [Sphingomonas sp. BT-65]
MGVAVWRVIFASLSLATAFSAAQAAPSPSAPQEERAQPDEAIRLARELVAKMTIEEKLPQLLNTAPAIPRLEIPAYNWWTESLHGALGPIPTTNFPEPVGLAATFDAPLVGQVAGVISMEVRAFHTLARQTGRLGRIGTGLDTWSPNINIFRDPRWGRGQETYGEDPFLTAEIGKAFIRGMQGPDPDRPHVIATPKHFAVHSGPEATRHHDNFYVSPYDLEDTYLPAFRAAIVEARAGSIMCAYNRVDGQPACASDLLLKDHLRGAWGFKGYVVSDCDAVRDIDENHKYAPDAAAGVAIALRSGVDNECNTNTLSDTAGLEHRYREALARGLLTESQIDESLVLLFAARYRTGDLPGVAGAPPAVPVGAIGAAKHRQLALHAAEKSMVLLKNAGILPLAPGARVAVIGPLGDATRVLRGNYSSTLTGPPVSIVDGLRAALGDANVTLVPFGASVTDGDRVPTSALRAPDGQPGVLVRYYNPATPVPTKFAPGTRDKLLQTVQYAAAPVVTRIEPDVGDRQLDLAQVADVHRRVFSGFLVPPATGTYRIGLTGPGGTLRFADRMIADRRKAKYNDLPSLTTFQLAAGKRYPFTIEGGGSDLVWKRISSTPDADLKRAAAGADTLVAVVGLTSDMEAEETSFKIEGFSGGDKTSLDLPRDQLAMLEQARATGKPVILVAMNGSPINLQWGKDHAAAVLEAWYPGEAGGTAAANILTGRTNPSGRLPLTFYRSVDDLPPFDDYSMKGRTYRYFTGAPVYSFGHGLSYTSFSYGPVEVRSARGGAQNGITVTTNLTNTGARAGDEVAQLYLAFPQRPGMPRVALRGFQRVSLKPGETKKLNFELSSRDISSVTPDGVRWVSPGNYRVTVGSGQPGTAVAGKSATFTVEKPQELPK